MYEDVVRIVTAEWEVAEWPTGPIACSLAVRLAVTTTKCVDCYGSTVMLNVFQTKKDHLRNKYFKESVCVYVGMWEKESLLTE